MNDAIIAAGSALLGAAVGGAASIVTAWLAAKQESKTRRVEADRAFREGLAEKHEERELAEYGRYSAHLAERGLVVANIIMAWGKPRPMALQDIARAVPPALVFVPPDVASELGAARTTWKALYERSYAAAQPAELEAFIAEYAQLRMNVDGTMERWAARLRSGKALLEHAVLARGTPQEK